MSLTKTQIDELIDRNCKSNSVSYSVEDKTADENLAIDFVYATIFEQGGTWQFDDSNHVDYPIITTNLITNQRDYAFVTDEQGNLVLDIYKVCVKDENGIFREIQPVDVQSDKDMESFYSGQDEVGVPTRYDKTANGIFLDKIPSYDSSSGLKVYINREGSYFADDDTTKMPGFAGLFHEYVALRPSYQYAYRNSLPNTRLLQNEMITMENKIMSYYGRRERDIKRRLKPNVENTK